MGCPVHLSAVVHESGRRVALEKKARPRMKLPSRDAVGAFYADVGESLEVPFPSSQRRGGCAVTKKLRSHLIAALILLLPLSLLADSSALIIRGVAGDPEHEEKFNKWTEGTQKALVEKFGFSADRVL